MKLRPFQIWNGLRLVKICKRASSTVSAGTVLHTNAPCLAQLRLKTFDPLRLSQKPNPRSPLCFSAGHPATSLKRCCVSFYLRTFEHFEPVVFLVFSLVHHHKKSPRNSKKHDFPARVLKENRRPKLEGWKGPFGRSLGRRLGPILLW